MTHYMSTVTELSNTLFTNCQTMNPLNPLNPLKQGDNALHIYFFIGNSIFHTEPGVANEILENEPKNFLAVAEFYSFILYTF